MSILAKGKDFMIVNMHNLPSILACSLKHKMENKMQRVATSLTFDINNQDQ